MTRKLGSCPVCGRSVFLVNDRYPKIPTRLRAHYPEPSWYYQDKPLPRTYCPGRTPKEKKWTDTPGNVRR